MFIVRKCIFICLPPYSYFWAAFLHFTFFHLSFFLVSVVTFRFTLFSLFFYFFFCFVGVMKSAMQYFLSLFFSFSLSPIYALTQLPRHHFNGVRSFFSVYFFIFFFSLSLLFPFCDLFAHISVGSVFFLIFFILFLFIFSLFFFMSAGCWLYFRYFFNAFFR